MPVPIGSIGPVVEGPRQETGSGDEARPAHQLRSQGASSWSSALLLSAQWPTERTKCTGHETHSHAPHSPHLFRVVRVFRGPTLLLPLLCIGARRDVPSLSTLKKHGEAPCLSAIRTCLSGLLIRAQLPPHTSGWGGNLQSSRWSRRVWRWRRRSRMQTESSLPSDAHSRPW